MRKNSVKNTRINSEIQKSLSVIIREEVKDPRVGFMTSVTRVEAAPDLKTCKVFISSLNKECALEDTVKALKRAEGFIRHQLADSLNLRNTPNLTFVADHSIEYGVHMNSLINEAMSHIGNDEDDESGDRDTEE